MPASSELANPLPAKPRTARFTLTLGKVSASVATLLGPNAHSLEFPSLLLPRRAPNEPPLGPGAMLTITVTRDLEAERAQLAAFETLQDEILEEFGTRPPSPPVLSVQNVTQTSVALEWEPLKLGSADLRALEMFRNGQRWGRITTDAEGKHEWKTGGLQSGEEYTFQLVLKTTAGTLASNLLRIRTHTMDNLSGLYVTFGTIQPPSLLTQLRGCLSEIGAREAPGMQLATTHFVCTTPLDDAETNTGGGSPRIDERYEAAMKANLPVVSPAWLLAVAAERRLVPIANYLLPSATVMSPTDTAPFRRPTVGSVTSPKSGGADLKRASLPTHLMQAQNAQHMSPPGKHASLAQQTIRSPSPETIARMSSAGPAMSPPTRAQSFDRSAGLPRVPGVLSPGGDDNLPSGSGSGSGSSSSKSSKGKGRPRSPKPEADGRLDRGFRFPLTVDQQKQKDREDRERGQKRRTSPARVQTNVDEADVPLTSTQPKIQTPIVHIQAPSTDGMSAPVGYTPDDEDEDEKTPKSTEMGTVDEVAEPAEPTTDAPKDADAKAVKEAAQAAGAGTTDTDGGNPDTDKPAAGEDKPDVETSKAEPEASKAEAVAVKDNAEATKTDAEASATDSAAAEAAEPVAEATSPATEAKSADEAKPGTDDDAKPGNEGLQAKADDEEGASLHTVDLS